MRRFFLIVVAVAAAWASPVTSAELQGDVNLLQDVITLLKSNWSPVQTWAGTVTIEDFSGAPKERPELRWSSEVEFSASRKSKASMWKLKLIEGENPVFIQVNGLVQGDKLDLLRKTRPTPTVDSIVDRYAGPRKLHESGPFAQSFEPFRYLGHWGEETADRLEYIRSHARNLSNEGWSIAKEGDLVTIKFETPDLLNRYVVDMAKGGNLVSYRGEERRGGKLKISDDWMWKYQQHDKTWLPTEIAIQWETYGDEASSLGDPVPISYSLRFIRWTKSEINVDEPEFTSAMIEMEKSK